MVPFLFIPTMGGAVLWGARGAAIGMCVAYGIYSFLGWFLLGRVVRRYQPDQVTEAPVMQADARVMEAVPQ